MAVLEIPTRTDVGAWNQQTTLENVPFRFRFRWNDRDGTYYMDLLDESENVIRAGVRLVVNFELLKRLVDGGRPPGFFLAFDARSNPQPPAFGQLGDEIFLTYTESTTPGI